MIEIIEKSVISLLINEPNEMDSFGLINKEDFTNHICGEIFAIIKSLIKNQKVVDIGSVSHDLEAFLKHDAFAIVCEYVRTPYKTENIFYYVESILNSTKFRQLEQLIPAIMTAAKIRDNDFLFNLPTTLENILSKSSIKLSTINDHMPRVIQVLCDRINSTGKLVGLETGFDELDNLTYGLQGGQLIILAARPGAGKSTLACNIAEHLALKKDTPIAFFSLEMSEEQILERIISSQTSLLAEEMKSGKYSNQDEYPAKFEEMVKNKMNNNFIIESPDNVDEIITKCKLAHKKNNIKFVVIDYLGLLLNGKHEHAYLILGEITRKLKKLSLKLNIPILLLSQMNREIDKDPNRESRLSDIRQSGNIEQDADIVMFIEYKQGDEYAILNVVKHRNGRPGKVLLKFEGHFNRFVNTNTSVEHFQNMKNSFLETSRKTKNVRTRINFDY